MAADVLAAELVDLVTLVSWAVDDSAFRALPTDEEDVKGMEEVDSLVTDVAATELTGVVAALVVVVIGSVVVSSRTLI